MSQDFSQYNGKKVTLTLTDGSEPVEGTIDSGNEMGVLFKPKGKASIDLIEAGRIQNVEVAPETPKKLQVKSLLPLKETQARQHLVDRHGYVVAEIEPMSEGDAHSFHEGLDHSPLGHNHEGKPKSEKDSDEE